MNAIGIKDNEDNVHHRVNVNEWKEVDNERKAVHSLSGSDLYELGRIKCT